MKMNEEEKRRIDETLSMFTIWMIRVYRRCVSRRCLRIRLGLIFLSPSTGYSFIERRVRVVSAIDTTTACRNPHCTDVEGIMSRFEYYLADRPRRLIKSKQDG